MKTIVKLLRCIKNIATNNTALENHFNNLMLTLSFKFFSLLFRK